MKPLESFMTDLLVTAALKQKLAWGLCGNGKKPPSSITDVTGITAVRSEALIVTIVSDNAKISECSLTQSRRKVSPNTTRKIITLDDTNHQRTEQQRLSSCRKGDDDDDDDDDEEEEEDICRLIARLPSYPSLMCTPQNNKKIYVSLPLSKACSRWGEVIKDSPDHSLSSSTRSTISVSDDIKNNNSDSSLPPAPPLRAQSPIHLRHIDNVPIPEDYGERDNKPLKTSSKNHIATSQERRTTVSPILVKKEMRSNRMHTKTATPLPYTFLPVNTSESRSGAVNLIECLPSSLLVLPYVPSAGSSSTTTASLSTSSSRTESMTYHTIQHGVLSPRRSRTVQGRRR